MVSSNDHLFAQQSVESPGNVVIYHPYTSVNGGRLLMDRVVISPARIADRTKTTKILRTSR